MLLLPAVWTNWLFWQNIKIEENCLLLEMWVLHHPHHLFLYHKRARTHTRAHTHNRWSTNYLIRWQELCFHREIHCMNAGGYRHKGMKRAQQSHRTFSWCQTLTRTSQSCSCNHTPSCSSPIGQQQNGGFDFLACLKLKTVPISLSSHDENLLFLRNKFPLFRNHCLRYNIFWTISRFFFCTIVCTVCTMQLKH